MIDIPIGLPARGYRICDIEAREHAKSRVFLGARWNVWGFESYKEANENYWRSDDEGISMRLWCIRDKLKEINETITRNDNRDYWRPILNSCSGVLAVEKSLRTRRPIRAGDNA
jgi:predicted RNase H-like nuclease